jgi:hypothetical protein
MQQAGVVCKSNIYYKIIKNYDYDYYNEFDTYSKLYKIKNLFI